MIKRQIGKCVRIKKSFLNLSPERNYPGLVLSSRAKNEIVAHMEFLADVACQSEFRTYAISAS